MPTIQNTILKRPIKYITVELASDEKLNTPFEEETDPYLSNQQLFLNQMKLERGS